MYLNLLHAKNGRRWDNSDKGRHIQNETKLSSKTATTERKEQRNNTRKCEADTKVRSETMKGEKVSVMM